VRNVGSRALAATMNGQPPRSGERPRAEDNDQRREPTTNSRLSPSPRARILPRAAFILWTPTIENRATGWLTPPFHDQWRHILLHTCARYELLCPAYVLMPDHAHLIWIGLNEISSDQRLAIEFLRKNLRPHLAPAGWQHQAHDHVLTEDERTRGAFLATATYVLENPCEPVSCHGVRNGGISAVACQAIPRSIRGCQTIGTASGAATITSWSYGPLETGSLALAAT